MGTQQENFNSLPPEWQAYVRARDHQQEMGRCYASNMAYLRASLMPPEPKIEYTQKLGFADSKEVRASINHLENELTSVKKMCHSHSKKRKEGIY